MENNYFNELNNININGKTEKKSGYTYLSWAWAWGEVKKKYPNATYEVVKYGEDDKPYYYDQNLGYMVMTKVTINEITHEMWLPVMDGANKAMKSESYEYKTKYGNKEVEAASMFDINKTIMRCLVKNIGMHGLGLYIYAGEDLPEEVEKENKQQEENKKQNQKEVTDKFNQLISVHGTNEEVYKLIGITRDKFIKDYEGNPAMLLELLNGY